MSANEGLKVLLTKLTALLHLTLSEEVLPEKVSSSVVELISQFATVSHEIKSKQNVYEQRESQYVKCLNEMENMVIYQKKEITSLENKLKKDTRDVAVDASISCQSCEIKDLLIEALRRKEIESQEIVDELEGQVRKSKMFIQAQQIMISGLRSGEKQDFNAPQQPEQPDHDHSSKWNSLFSTEAPVTCTRIPSTSQPSIASPVVTVTSPTRPPLPPTAAIPHRYRVDETHSDDDEDYLEEEDGADPDSAAAVQEAFGGDFTGEEEEDGEEEGAERDRSDSSSDSYDFEGEEGESTEGDYAEGIGGFDHEYAYYDEMSEELHASADQDEAALHTKNKQDSGNQQRKSDPQRDRWREHEEEESGSLELSVDPSWSYSNSDNSDSIEKVNSSAESAASIEGNSRRHWEGLVEDGNVEDSFSLIQNFYEIK